MMECIKCSEKLATYGVCPHCKAWNSWPVMK